MATAYRTFGSKANVFKGVVEAAVAGGAVRAETPPEDRPAIRAIRDETDAPADRALRGDPAGDPPACWRAPDLTGSLICDTPAAPAPGVVDHSLTRRSMLKSRWARSIASASVQVCNASDQASSPSSVSTVNGPASISIRLP
jgi:hypothetical protein